MGRFGKTCEMCQTRALYLVGRRFQSECRIRQSDHSRREP